MLGFKTVQTGGAKRLRFFFVLALLILALTACKGKRAQHQPRPVLEEGKPAPTFTLKGYDGNSVDIAARKGKVVLINFWATWCPTCREEMPSLQRFHAAMKAEPSLVVYCVPSNNKPSDVRDYMSKNGMTLPMLNDPDSEAAAAYGITGVPETYILDKKGILRRKIIGPIDFDTPEAYAFFKALLAEAP